MDLATSSAVNLPIISASLRFVVVCIGIRSIRCTYSAARVPTRFVFTTNLVVFMVSLIHSTRRYDSLLGAAHCGSGNRTQSIPAPCPTSGHVLLLRLRVSQSSQQESG